VNAQKWMSFGCSPVTFSHWSVCKLHQKLSNQTKQPQSTYIQALNLHKGDQGKLINVE